MRKITLVCSAHRANGLCNAEELLKILRAIEPEVVFEEIRPSDLDSYYKTKWSLEAQSVTKYREFRSPKQVPVDRYDIRPDLLVRMKAEFDQVLDYVGQASEEYRELDNEHAESVREHGFRYLNSDAFAAREARMSEIEDRMIKGTDNRDAMRVLEKWRHLNQAREVEMTASIYEYCRENAFDTGVFLVGAAHKTGIVKEIGKYASAEADLINWIFFT
jgi:predicted nuclease of restriction endonuclease-like RecB superfamily